MIYQQKCLKQEAQQKQTQPNIPELKTGKVNKLYTNKSILRFYCEILFSITVTRTNQFAECENDSLLEQNVGHHTHTISFCLLGVNILMPVIS